MESNKLQVLDRQIPLRNYPEVDLNGIILGPFLDWVSRLLSINTETGADKLEVALPAIKEHCWSMGFAEIKTMFEMYADNKLNVEPIPNHLDRIQLGKIVEAYRKQKPRPKPVIEQQEVTPEEQERLIISGVSNAYEIYKQTKKIEPGYLWVYYHLHELSLLPDHTKEFKQGVQKRAVERFESRKGLVNDYQKAKEMIQNKGDKIAVICKEIILEDYFESLVKENINILEKL